MLNPLSTIYCRHASSSSRSLLPGGHHKADPTLIPLVFNNTVPAKVTYTLTSFDDPPTSHQVTVPASSLVRHAHPSHHRNRGDASSSSSSSTQNNLDDELALASEWALVPASSSSNPHGGASGKGASPQHALRHRLPSDGPAAASAPDKSDPFGLAPSESLYYLPVSALGLVRLDSVVDKDGHSVRIRRKRAITAASTASAGSADPGAVALAFEEVRIVRCPSAGFDLGATRSADEEHRCLVPNAGLPESWPLGLAVSGSEPLSVRWHARVGDPQRGVRKDETLDGIVGGGDGSGGDDVVPVPMNVSLAQAGRTTYYLDAVVDAYGNEVTYDLARASALPVGTTKDKAPSASRNKALPHLLPGTVTSRSVVVHRPPEVAFVGECAKGDDVHLLEGGRKKLQLRLQGVDDDLRAGDGAFDVQVRFSPAAQGVEGWTRLVKTQTARAEVEVDQAGTYEVVGVKSKHCTGAVLVPNTVRPSSSSSSRSSSSRCPILTFCRSVAVHARRPASPNTLDHFHADPRRLQRRDGRHRLAPPHGRAAVRRPLRRHAARPLGRSRRAHVAQAAPGAALARRGAPRGARSRPLGVPLHAHRRPVLPGRRRPARGRRERAGVPPRGRRGRRRQVEER